MGASAIQLKITLRYTTPPVWRRLVVPGSLTLAELHTVVQTAMGWTDVHLHLFEADGVVYGDVDDMDDEAVGEEDDTTLTAISRKGSTFRYEYDFGDGWQHDVLVEQVQTVSDTVTPACLDGRRACPPEECGGPSGYQHLVAVLADPSDPEHAQMLHWLGADFDPEEFDIDATNELLAL